MDQNQNYFKYMITETDQFVITCEHVPGRVARDKKLDDIITFAERGKETGLVHAISLTDNPSGAPAILPDGIAREIEQVGLPAIVHFSSKDMNRNMIESRALSLNRTGIRNLLVMCGDYPTMGQSGLPMPVFDVDAVHILTMLTLMNKGWRIEYDSHMLEAGPGTNFFHGAVVSPYKFTGPDTMLQLYKMEKKARAGASFFVTQFGFDTAKLKDFMSYLKQMNLSIPILGSVFILRKGAAGVMHRGDIPGSFVTDELLHTIRKESETGDKGRAASLERAAMQVAVLKGLGFKGAHIEAMVLKFDMIETILRRAEELQDSWEECAEKLNFSPDGSFYRGTTDTTVNPAISSKLKKGWVMYRIMRIVHRTLFIKEGFPGSVMRAYCRMVDSIKPLGAVSHFFERILKELLFNCQDCGDCALPELHFLCSQSQCPKQQRNGPCGGSRLGACEVYPDRPCVWARIYARSMAFKELDKIQNTLIGPRDWNLNHTSSWINFHLSRDHAAYDFKEFLGVKEREEA